MTGHRWEPAVSPYNVKNPGAVDLTSEYNVRYYNDGELSRLVTWRDTQPRLFGFRVLMTKGIELAPPRRRLRYLLWRVFTGRDPS